MHGWNVHMHNKQHADVREIRQFAYKNADSSTPRSTANTHGYSELRSKFDL